MSLNQHEQYNPSQAGAIFSPAAVKHVTDKQLEFDNIKSSNTGQKTLATELTVSKEQIQELNSPIPTASSEGKTLEAPKEAELYKMPEKPKEKGFLGKLLNFIATKVLLGTTVLAATLNAVSAPLRAFAEDSVLKTVVNKASMLVTKLHLFIYGLTIFNSGLEKKNPLWLFSSLGETAVALNPKTNVDNVYLERGPFVGLDSFPAAFEEYLKELGYEGTDFSKHGYKEALRASFQVLKRIVSEVKEDPSIIWKKKKHGHLLVVSGTFMALGTAIGLTVSKTIGNVMRDVAGMFNDLGLAFKDGQFGIAGGMYFAGSLCDIAAAVMEKATGSKLFSSDSNAVGRFSQATREIAILLDRLGQLGFAWATQEKLEGAPTTVNNATLAGEANSSDLGLEKTSLQKNAGAELISFEARKQEIEKRRQAAAAVNQSTSKNIEEAA